MILDVGCSDNPKGQINIDLSFTHQDRGQAKLDVLASGLSLPFRDHTFEMVYSSHVIEHVENPYQFVRELGRVSNKFVYIETPNNRNWRYYLHDIIDDYAEEHKMTAHRFQGFSENHLKRIFEFSDLQVLKVAYRPILDRWSNTTAYGTRKLDRFLKWLPQFNLREIQVLGQKKVK